MVVSDLDNEFADLLEIEPKAHKTVIPDWEGEIPENVVRFVTKVYHTGKVYPIPASEEEVLRRKSVFRAALAKIAPDKAANFRDKFDKDTGEQVGFSFSVGE